MSRFSTGRMWTLAMFAMIAAALGAQAQTWDCGATPGTVTATLSGGTLTISGNGNMAYYSNANSLPWYDSKSSITKVIIENGVTSIEVSAFDGCTGLTSVTIPNSMIYIEREAFSGCTNLKSVTIPNSVISIGYGVFSGCTGLTSVTIPNSVIYIERGAFFGCTGLTSIEVDDGNPVYRSVDGVLIESQVTSQTTLVQYPASKQGTSYSIPNGVTSIWDNAFRGCTELTSLTIPNSVISIGQLAFWGCTGLTSVTIGNNVTSIGNYAFYMCTSLMSVTIPNSVTSIELSAFSGCTGLTSVTIPNSVTSIGKDAFSGCTGLTSVTIPNSVTSIGNGAFFGCTGLTSMTIPNSMTSIENNTFYNCNGLTSVTIPNSVTDIGQYAFSGCTSLMSVTIPNSVTSIGKRAFSDNSLTSVISLGNVPPVMEPDVFRYASMSSICLYVPQSAIAAYRSADGWKDFTCINPSDVTFDSKGGSNIDLQRVSYGGKVTKPSDPTLMDYIFDGWYKETTSTTLWNFDVDVVTSDITLYAKWASTVSILSPERVIPNIKPNEEATVIAPVSQLPGEFTAGPNPVARAADIVNFFRQGKRIESASLTIYDATGNVVNKVKITDNVIGNQARRLVGSWNLRDGKGRLVSDGAYVVKGVVKMSDGKKEKVSVIVGVR